MKKLKFLGVAAAAGLVLLTSCMDGKNEQKFAAFGVVGMSDKTFVNVIYNNNYYYPIIYIPEIADNSDLQGESTCLYFGTIINGDDPKNVNASQYGYYTGIYNGHAKIDKIYANSSVDTINITRNELALLDVNLFDFVKDHLFLGALNSTFLKDQKNDYSLSWDYQQEPQIENGQRVYTLYLRGVKMRDGESPSASEYEELRASNLSDFYNRVKSKEQAEGKEQIYFKVNYIKEFNADTTGVKTWGSSKTVTLAIPKAEQ